MARWVIKIGSSLITDNGKGIDRAAMSNWCAQIAQLRQQGHEIILVSSGAVAEGFIQLGFDKRPETLHELQAAAAVGQMGLMQTWADLLKTHTLKSAQILLTHDDLKVRKRYLNGRNTVMTLLRLGIIPVVNENDTVVTDEIRFGDNDTLGALVANIARADNLIILTDQKGLYTADPRKDSSAELIAVAKASDEKLLDVAGGSMSGLGRGGMTTKIQAARLAAKSGATTFIASGKEENIITRLADGEALGTKLTSDTSKENARKQWIAGHSNINGKLVLDDGAALALSDKGKSLLPVGIIHVSGTFERGDAVYCENQNGKQIAIGLVNFNNENVEKIIGLSTAEAKQKLDYAAESEVIHRDNLVLI